MQILRHYENTPDDVRGGVVVMGNFDGVHRGHQAVIGKGAELAQDRKEPLVVVTFEPHPRKPFKGRVHFLMEPCCHMSRVMCEL